MERCEARGGNRGLRVHPGNRLTTSGTAVSGHRNASIRAPERTPLCASALQSGRAGTAEGVAPRAMSDRRRRPRQGRRPQQRRRRSKAAVVMTPLAMLPTARVS
jgi:hypothetical protein